MRMWAKESINHYSGEAKIEEDTYVDSLARADAHFPDEADGEEGEENVD